VHRFPVSIRKLMAGVGLEVQEVSGNRSPTFTQIGISAGYSRYPYISPFCMVAVREAPREPQLSTEQQCSGFRDGHSVAFKGIVVWN